MILDNLNNACQAKMTRTWLNIPVMSHLCNTSNTFSHFSHDGCCLKVPTDSPRWSQDGPQDGPKRPQESPKKAPRWPQDGVKMTPKAKMTRSWLNIPVISHFCNTSHAFSHFSYGVSPRNNPKKAPG